tara:strand:- start:192 stop:569 length:378 start_codon:yes stop_codon:yes gene_type:complete
MLRKIKSCPANLCNMAHRKKPKESKSPEATFLLLPSKTSKIIKKGDAVDEIVTSSLLDINVNDPTEQLFILLVLKKLISKTKYKFSSFFYEILVRGAISCLTHKIMHITITNLHSYSNVNLNFIH